MENTHRKQFIDKLINKLNLTKALKIKHSTGSQLKKLVANVQNSIYHILRLCIYNKRLISKVYIINIYIFNYYFFTCILL